MDIGKIRCRVGMRPCFVTNVELTGLPDVFGPHKRRVTRRLFKNRIHVICGDYDVGTSSPHLISLKYRQEVNGDLLCASAGILGKRLSVFWTNDRGGTEESTASETSNPCPMFSIPFAYCNRTVCFDFL